MKITMLGTGNALVTRCYNTCFVMDNGQDLLLVDAGGGNGVLSQLERAGISGGDIHNIFVTHAHSDHILGVIWMVRVFIQRHLAGKFSGELHVWSHEKVLRVLNFNLQNMLTSKQYAEVGRCVLFHEVHDGDEIDCASFHLKVFDILSTNEANGDVVKGADWLLCEAFCKYADRDVFHPYEKHHSTARDAAQLAQRLGVANLILYHTEDKTLATRKHDYTAEARSAFDGNVFVPDDLEEIIIQ